MPDLWRAQDRFGRAVRLTDSAMDHVLERRPRMAGSEFAIRAVIQTPERVNKDALHPDRECFYARQGDGPYLKVVVAYGVDGSGLVITAHPTKYIKRGEQQRWP